MKKFAKTALSVAFALGCAVPSWAANQALSADVVVIGAGSAGLTAAVQAAEKNAKVVLLEKNPFVGGCSSFAEGLFAVESELQRLRSDTFNIDSMFEGMLERHLFEVKPSLVRQFMEHSGENIAWLQGHGIKFEVVRMTPWEEATWHCIGEYTNKAGEKTVHGAALVNALKDHADRLGVTTLTNTPATSLIANNKGDIVGVNAKVNGKDDTYTINAKAVIVAAGGFGDSPEKIEKWAHRDPAGWEQSVHINKTGDGIQMSLDKGAALGPVTFIGHLGSEGKAIPFASDIYTTSWQPSALWVNSDGERFVNEGVAFSFSQAANVVYNQFGHRAWSIFDESQVEYMEKRGVDSGVGVIVPVGAKLGKLREQIKDALAADSDGFKSASSVAEMAGKLGIPAANLEKALADYNRACEVQHDGVFLKDKRYLRPIDTSKMYAIRLRANFFSSIGGLRINSAFQVLDTKNQPIKGLYAAGLEVSDVVGHTYTTWTSGYAFGFASYSGRYAALEALKANGIQ